MKSQKENRKSHYNMKAYIMGGLFIIVGLLFLGRNFGIIDPNIFRIIVSWPMLLIVLALVQLLKRNYVPSIVLFAVALFFLLPRLTNLSTAWLHNFWPIFLIILGIMFLIRPKRKFAHPSFRKNRHSNEASFHSEDGFLSSENLFGSAHHIVLNPVFKGAILKSTFSSTIIDLRHTRLEAEEVFIDIDCTFAGIEIFAPNNWNIIPNAKATMGGYHDKRHQDHEQDYTHKVIIRGNIIFGGLEIKN